MLKMTCYNCHWSWFLTPEGAQAAYDELEPGATHYVTQCPKCGRVHKVPIKQLKQALPREVEQKDEGSE